jgi:hypothetical protein
MLDWSAHPCIERSSCHCFLQFAQDAMTAANLQPVGDVDRTDLLDAFEKRFGAGVRPLLQCKKQSGGRSYLSEVRPLHHLLAPLPWHHHLWACYVSQCKHSLGCTTPASPRTSGPVAGLDVRRPELQCRALRQRLPQLRLPSIHPCGNTITFADDNFDLVSGPGQCQLGPCAPHTGTCRLP